MGEREDFTVAVAGDVSYDWNIAHNDENGAKTAHASFQAGGAALLRDLIARVAEQSPEGPVASARVLPEGAPQVPCPTDDSFNQRFAVWSRHLRDKDNKEEAEQVWRVQEFLGRQRASADTTQPARAAVEDPAQKVDLLALHDADLGFRDHPELWPRTIREPDQAPPWVLLRTVQPIGTGPLCDRLQELADRTIVVIRIDDLRLGGMHVTRELSWERTAQDLLAELCANQHLANCAHVVVSFTTAGALLLSRAPEGDGERDCQLIFDPEVMERMWNERYPGGMIGGVTALTASIVREVIREPERPDVAWGVQRGIKAMRELDRYGYDEAKHPGDEFSVGYPFDRVVPELCRELDPGEKKPFAEAPVSGRSPSHPSLTRIFGGSEKPWTILEDRHHGEDLLELATRMVEEGGARALPEVPRGKFGKLLTFDRGEIEGLQSVRALISQYDQRERSQPGRQSHPLSIAVFGPPGAGKSWGVRQVAGSVIGDRATALTFNLSQFDEPRGLIDALHQVRDVSLAGKLPLVLWDEFDTSRVTAGGQQKLGWLPHFLSPMEDGEFQDGQLTHPIGPAVFVFAGGVYDRMERFAADAASFEDAKAPDFVSRLSGYLDVVGPNPRDGERRKDPYFVVRRAVMVRSMLERTWEDIFHPADDRSYRQPAIDPGVLTALLLTREYRHGSRSLESIIASSIVPEQDSFGRSDLPSEAQLDLHVDAPDFLRIVRETPASGAAPVPVAVD